MQLPKTWTLSQKENCGPLSSPNINLFTGGINYRFFRSVKTSRAHSLSRAPSNQSGPVNKAVELFHRKRFPGRLGHKLRDARVFRNVSRLDKESDSINI